MSSAINSPYLYNNATGRYRSVESASERYVAPKPPTITTPAALETAKSLLSATFRDMQSYADHDFKLLGFSDQEVTEIQKTIQPHLREYYYLPLREGIEREDSAWKVMLGMSLLMLASNVIAAAAVVLYTGTMLTPLAIILPLLISVGMPLSAALLLRLTTASHENFLEMDKTIQARAQSLLLENAPQ